MLSVFLLACGPAAPTAASPPPVATPDPQPTVAWQDQGAPTPWLPLSAAPDFGITSMDGALYVAGIRAGRVWRVSDSEAHEALTEWGGRILGVAAHRRGLVLARRHGDAGDATRITLLEGDREVELWAGPGAPDGLAALGDQVAWITNHDGTRRLWWTAGDEVHELAAPANRALAWQGTEPPALWFVRAQDHQLVRQAVGEEAEPVPTPENPKALVGAGATMWWRSGDTLHRARGDETTALALPPFGGGLEVEAATEQTACWTAHSNGYCVQCWHQGEPLRWMVPDDRGGQNLRGLAIHDGHVVATTPSLQVQQSVGFEPVHPHGALLRMKLP